MSTIRRTKSWTDSPKNRVRISGAEMQWLFERDDWFAGKVRESAGKAVFVTYRQWTRALALYT